MCFATLLLIFTEVAIFTILEVVEEAQGTKKLDE